MSSISKVTIGTCKMRVLAVAAELWNYTALNQASRFPLECSHELSIGNASYRTLEINSSLSFAG